MEKIIFLAEQRSTHVAIAIALGFCVMLITAAASANPFFINAPASTIVMMDSEPGDYIGQGLYSFYSLADGTFTAQSHFDNGVSIFFHSQDYSHWWYLDFAAPNNGALAVGTYSGATRFPFQAAGEPGLDVSGDGHVCNTLTGSFEVKEISYGTNNDILSFWATFEQHCEGLPPALRGEIRFNAAAPNTVTSIKTSPNPQYPV